MKHVPVHIWVRSDPELVEGIYEGDHAGKYELSQLMYIRPDLVDMEAIAYQNLPGAGGRMALGSDAAEASPEQGKKIMQACLDYLCAEADRLKQNTATESIPKVTYSTVELVWSEVLQRVADL